MRIFKILFFLLLISFTNAATVNNYSDSEFQSIMNNKGSAVFHIWATWCPTCRKQNKIFDYMLEENEFKNLKMIKVNYDYEKSFLKQFRVNHQSTFIVIKDGKEIFRSTGETREDELRKMLRLVS